MFHVKHAGEPSIHPRIGGRSMRQCRQWPTWTASATQARPRLRTIGDHPMSPRLFPRMAMFTNPVRSRDSRRPRGSGSPQRPLCLMRMRARIRQASSTSRWTLRSARARARAPTSAPAGAPARTQSLDRSPRLRARGARSTPKSGRMRAVSVILRARSAVQNRRCPCGSRQRRATERLGAGRRIDLLPRPTSRGVLWSSPLGATPSTTRWWYPSAPPADESLVDPLSQTGSGQPSSGPRRLSGRAGAGFPTCLRSFGPYLGSWPSPTRRAASARRPRR